MHSMTGFGRGSATSETWHAAVEINSVNRKQAEVVVQAPRELSELDGRIRKAVLGVVSRGRIQVSITLERGQGALAAIRVDKMLAQAFHRAFVELGQAVGHEVTLTAADYLRQPGILNTGTADIDVEDAWRTIKPALDEALAALAMMRETEGSHLRQDLLARLDLLTAFVAKITAEAPARPVRQRELLDKRLRDAGLDLDPADERVARELALFADRCDVSEELTRLDSHFTKFREYLQAAEAAGPRAGFPLPGAFPRVQHHRLKGQRRRHRPNHRRGQDRAGENPRAGPERGVSVR
jgi:uncharacterized protein (TIGR00255 family)